MSRQLGDQRLSIEPERLHLIDGTRGRDVGSLAKHGDVTDHRAGTDPSDNPPATIVGSVQVHLSLLDEKRCTGGLSLLEQM